MKLQAGVFFFLIAFVFLIHPTYGLSVDLSINKEFVVEPLYFQYNDTIKEFSTEIQNSGSLAYIAQFRTDVFSNDSMIFTAWSEPQRMMPGNNGHFRLFWLPNLTGEYTVRYRVYYGGEILEDAQHVNVTSLANSSGAFNVSLYGDYGRFLILQVQSSARTNAAIVPYNYPIGWVAQKYVDLMPGMNRVIVPYELPVAKQIDFAVVSEGGKYANTGSVDLRGEKTLSNEIIRFLFGI